MTYAIVSRGDWRASATVEKVRFFQRLIGPGSRRRNAPAPVATVVMKCRRFIEPPHRELFRNDLRSYAEAWQSWPLRVKIERATICANTVQMQSHFVGVCTIFGSALLMKKGKATVARCRAATELQRASYFPRPRFQA